MTIANKNKRKIFEFLLKEENPFGETEENGVLKFVKEIWDIKMLPSEDDRYSNAEEDIIQHTIRNNDWDLNYLFENRLKLYDTNEKFILFIETVVSPIFRTNEDEIIRYVIGLNEILETEGLKLVVVEYLDDYSSYPWPIYKVDVAEVSMGLPIDVKQNGIPFFVEKDKSGRSNVYSSHNKPNSYPAFMLVFNSGWNDFGISTVFDLFYYAEEKEPKHLGVVKIMSLGNDVIDVIPDEFTQLGSDFCSLGTDFEYYASLNKTLGLDFISVLFALQDSAFFSEIQERFENEDSFKTSLLRSNESERILREGKHLFGSGDLKNLYSFDYHFKPIFSSETLSVNFDFGQAVGHLNRVYALIGKNGTGKTQLITSLPVNIARKNKHHFQPEVPLFSKVIAVSYSVFDSFQIPKKTATFNYEYCGLRNDKGEMITEKGLLLRFHNTWKKIHKMERTNQWRSVLLNFIDQEMVDMILEKRGHDKYEFSMAGFQEIRKKLSSGQSIVLYIISQIVANIRFDSLLLFDEPETHLHPNAITQLMSTIYSLVEEFQSFCILATHSPLVVRECFSRNVFVIERHEDFPSIRKIGLESFGQNLTILTDEVFGNKEVPKQYKKIIQDLVSQGKSYNEIVEYIEFDNIPLNLNAKIYIKSITKEDA